MFVEYNQHVMNVSLGPITQPIIFLITDRLHVCRFELHVEEEWYYMLQFVQQQLHVKHV